MDRLPESMDRRKFLEKLVVTGVSLTIGNTVMDVRAAVNDQINSGQTPLPIILVHFDGGLSQIESFDARMNLKSGYGSGIGSIQTETGAIISKVFSNTASLADRLTVVRTLKSRSRFHSDNTEDLLLLDKTENFGVKIAEAMGKNSHLNVYVQADFDGRGDGLEGEMNSVLAANNPPHMSSSVLNLPRDGKRYQSPVPLVSLDRLPGRLDLFDQIAQYNNQSSAFDRYHSQFSMAAKILHGGATVLSEPSVSDLKNYGDNCFGRSTYIAGRLLDAGAMFITVRNGHWDLHENIDLMEQRAPPVDQAIAALIRDCERGIIPPFVLCAASEIGRDPTINDKKGRGHWPDAHSGIFYGGRFKRGGIFGTTDNDFNPIGDERIPLLDLKHIAAYAAYHNPLLPRKNMPRMEKYSSLFNIKEN